MINPVDSLSQRLAGMLSAGVGASSLFDALSTVERGREAEGSPWRSFWKVVDAHAG